MTIDEEGLAWRRRASELAEATFGRLVNTKRHWGQYVDPSKREHLGSNALTYPPKNRRGKLFLSKTDLVRHYEGNAARHIIGFHSTSEENTSRWFGIDIDAHEGQDADPKAKFLLAIAIFKKLQELGLVAILEDSNGKGGFHIWVFFSSPVPTEDVFHFVKRVLQQVPGGKDIETFPKQAKLSNGSLGNWIRGPGRHWRGNHWSRFYCDGDWLTGDAAVTYWINAPINAPEQLPARVETPTSEALSPDATLLSLSEAEAFLARLAPGRVNDYSSWIQVGQAVHSINSGEKGLQLWDKWSQQSEKYRADECATKWKGFGQHKGLTGRSLAAWANLDNPSVPGKKSRPDPVGDMLTIVNAVKVELWHTTELITYITIHKNDTHEHFAIRGVAFDRWIVSEYALIKHRAPAPNSRLNVIDLLDAEAIREGATYPIYVRTATIDGTTYIDVGNKRGEAIEITSTGWRIIVNPPVRFVRPQGLKVLPIPTDGGSVNALLKFLSVTSEDQQVLLLAAILSYVRGQGPFPILVFQGEQGSAKTTASRLVRAIIDPSSVPLSSLPRDERDLAINAGNSYLLAYDNVSHMSSELSDAFCRCATGGGFRTRELYRNREEVLFEYVRPVMLNGIDAFATRADLRDRAIIIELPVIPKAARRPEFEFWRDFYSELPSILGGLYTALSKALKEEESIQLETLPRMADFAKLAAAAENGLGWAPGQFMYIYDQYIKGMRSYAVEHDPVAKAIVDLVQEGEFRGTATELLERLHARTAHDASKLPQSPQWIVNRLKRAAPELRSVGVAVEFITTGKQIHLKWAGPTVLAEI